MAPKYCVECDSIKLIFDKNETRMAFMSNGSEVKEQKASFVHSRAGDSLTINLKCFIDVSTVPKQYTIEDLLKMIERNEVKHDRGY